MICSPPPILCWCPISPLSCSGAHDRPCCTLQEAISTSALLPRAQRELIPSGSHWGQLSSSRKLLFVSYGSQALGIMLLLVWCPLLVHSWSRWKQMEISFVAYAEPLCPCALELGNLDPQAPSPDTDEKALDSENLAFYREDDHFFFFF